MNKIHIAIGADHHGFLLKKYLMKERSDNVWLDEGTYNDQSSDYPLYAAAVCHSIQKHKALYGVLFCGTGIGMAIAANRFAGIRASLVWNILIAREARQEDNSNVLVLPADHLSKSEVLEIFDVWIATQFSDKERYRRRIELIEMMGKYERMV